MHRLQAGHFAVEDDLGPVLRRVGGGSDGRRL